MYIDPSNVFTLTDLQKLIKQRQIDGSITIRGTHLDSVEGVEKIVGTLGLSDSSLCSLGDLTEITGDFWISIHDAHPQLKNLGRLERVAGNMSLRYSGVTDLANLRRVEGNLSLRDTPIEHLGALEYVGGNLHLPKRLEGKLNLSGVTVKGKIKYWNDSKDRKETSASSNTGLTKAERTVPYWEHTYVFSLADLSSATPEQSKFYRYFRECFLNGRPVDPEGNSNYEFILLYDLLGQYDRYEQFDNLQKHLEDLGRSYPKTEPYGVRMLCDLLMKNGDFERVWAWKKSRGEWHQLTDIYEFELRLGRSLLDGELMSKLGGYSYLTNFGQSNILQINPLSENFLKEFESERGGHFFEAFFIRSAPLDSEEFPFSSFDQEYYRPFYLSQAEFEFYKEIDDSQAKRKVSIGVTHVSQKAALSQFRLFLKKAEDLYRESIGMPRVGEGWISETELFYRIAKAFPQYTVIHHGRPKWLGAQHLDIYIPEINVGIEYQGAQHYTAVEFFGGDDGLQKTLERDAKKRNRCDENRCTLIYVKEQYVFEDVRFEIQQNIG